MSQRKLTTALGGATLAAIGLAMVGPASASSHREAPAITETPKVDGTDFYMFRSYEDGREDFVTLIANYLPLQDAYGGPNYFALDPDALYEIHIDNDGDAVEDITFQFQFNNSFAPAALPIGPDGSNVTIPLINAGGIGPGPGDTDNLGVQETFSVNVIRGDRRSGTSQAATNVATNGTMFRKPVDYIGQKSIPNYEEYANAHIWEMAIPGCSTNGRVFAGQRQEGFVVNLGEVFDLINLNPLAARDSGVNIVGNKNVTSLAVEVPVDCLTDGDPVVGGWTTASLPQAQVRNPAPQGPANAGGDVAATVQGGAFVQVSRLGSPLVNEVVIGLDQKDLFNASEPASDLDNFATFVTHPTLPVLIDVLFPDTINIPATPRNDLVAAFVTGIRTDVNGTATNFTQPQAITDGTGVPGEMLRLNTAFPGTPTPAGDQSDLGFLACDLSGFPNGRRPIDDVVDIELTAVLGILAGNPNNLQTCDVSGASPQVVNAGAVVNDGAQPVASDYRVTFPYLATPIAGSPNMTATR